jgi:aminoglycoside phosphotransferase (APT) family kinase protein
LTPALAAEAPIAIPVVEYHGSAGGLSFAGYRAIPGQALRELGWRPGGGDPRALIPDLAAFFRHLHGFDVEHARACGLLQSDYPLSMQDDFFLTGSARDLYRRDLEALRACGMGDPELVRFLERMVQQYLARVEGGSVPTVLLHGEVSGHHVLADRTGRITGIIDFNGMLIEPPVRDFMYIYEECGRAFTRDLIEAYGMLDPDTALGELQFLHVWHTLARLLWAVDHSYGPGIERRYHELQALREDPPDD